MLVAFECKLLKIFIFNISEIVLMVSNIEVGEREGGGVVKYIKMSIILGLTLIYS